MVFRKQSKNHQTSVAVVNIKNGKYFFTKKIRLPFVNEVKAAQWSKSRLSLLGMLVRMPSTAKTGLKLKMENLTVGSASQ
jgi:hypothetical protein